MTVPLKQSMQGKVALVVGGSRGAGRWCALEFAVRGAGVVVMGRNERALGETVGEIANAAGKGRLIAGDVGKSEDRAAALQKAVDSFGGVDILVCAAANGTAAEEMMRAAASHMREEGRAIILVRAGSPEKAKALSIAQAMANEFGARMRCNVIGVPSVEAAREEEAFRAVAGAAVSLVVGTAAAKN